MALVGVIAPPSFKLLQEADHAGATQLLAKCLKSSTPNFFKGSRHPQSPLPSPKDLQHVRPIGDGNVARGGKGDHHSSTIRPRRVLLPRQRALNPPA
jgi:hypothetical protein